MMGPQPDCHHDDTKPTVSREKGLGTVGFVRAGHTNTQKGILPHLSSAYNYL